jgi:NAD(P)-dependent dehydrogenase (short-subunit alcohol dehydrogenase family)
MSEFDAPEARIALVTGAGRGLGRELALALAGHGLQVAALGRKADDLDALAGESDRILPVVADVADTQSLTKAFQQIDTELGPVDTLINNAAVYPHRDFLDETPGRFMATININLGGMAACAMLALDRMVPRAAGRIVNVTSFAGLNPTHHSSAYSVSKGAGRILTAAMVRDLEDRFPDIVISDWVPGALKTSMGIPEGIDPAEAAGWGAKLAMMRDPALNGATFLQSSEHLPIPSFKRRLFYKLTGRKVAPRSLT